MKLARRGMVAAAALVALSAGGCESDDARYRLNSRCEVPLSQLERPLVRVEDFLTEPGSSERLDPNHDCELFLFDHDPSGGVPTGLELIEAGQWEMTCEDRPEELTGCRLAVEDELLHEYDDGVMLCWRLEGDCGVAPPGERTVCRAGTPFGVEPVIAAAEGPGTAAVLAVDEFPGSGLVAVTWMKLPEGENLPAQHVVSWLRVEGDEIEYVHDEDLCETVHAYVGYDARIEAQAHVAAQTARRGDALLVASPCGYPLLAEVRPGPDMTPYPVVDALTTDEEGGPCPEPDAVLGVFQVEAGYVATWTDGIALHTSFLEEDGAGGLRPTGCRRVADTLDTQSREEPSALCFELTELAEDPVCVVAWSELTRFSRDGPFARGGARESTIHFGLLSTDEEVREAAAGFGVLTGEGIGSGFGPHLAGVIPEGATFHEHSGIVAYRDESLGLLVRGWAASGLDGVGELSSTLGDSIVQLTDAAAVSDLSIYFATPSTFTVAWTESRPGGTQGLAAAVVGLGPGETAADGPAVAHASLSIPGFDAAWSPGDASGWDAPRPQVVRGFVDYGLPSKRAVLLVAAPDTRDGACRTGFAVADLAPAVDLPEDPLEWPREVRLELLGVPGVTYEPTPGACEPGCGGAALFDGEGFVVALPDASHGVSLWSVSPPAGDGDATAVERIAATRLEQEAGCAVTLGLEPDGVSGRVYWDAVPDGTTERVLRGLALTKTDGVWTGHRRAVEIDGGATGSATTPHEPIAYVDEEAELTSLLLWRDNPFGDWPQRDFRLGSVVDEVGRNTLAVSTIQYPYTPVVDSRVSSALGLPVACDDQGGPEGDDLCALIAFDRPDFSEFRDVGGYNRLSQLTPVVETVLAQVGVDDAGDEVSSLLTPVELLAGEAWRGLPTSLVSWDAGDGHPMPFGVFSRASPLVWDLGAATVFDFQRPWSVADGVMTEPVSPESDSSPWLWQAQDVAPTWMFEDPSGEREIPLLRIGPGSGDQLVGVWVGRTPSAAGGDDQSINLTLLSVELAQAALEGGAGAYEASFHPEASRAIVDVDQGLERADPGSSALRNDARALLAEHLQAAVSPLAPADGETARFIVGWIDRRWNEGFQTHSGARVAAALVTCELVTTSQRGQ